MNVDPNFIFLLTLIHDRHTVRVFGTSVPVNDSAVVGTLFATRVPANLLPAGTRVPVYWKSITNCTRVPIDSSTE